MEYPKYLYNFSQNTVHLCTLIGMKKIIEETGIEDIGELIKRYRLYNSSIVSQLKQIEEFTDLEDYPVELQPIYHMVIQYRKKREKELAESPLLRGQRGSILLRAKDILK